MGKILTIENLDVTYVSTAKKVLSDFNLSMEKGEVVAILGPSGCGKTTLLNAIANLLDKEEAEVSGDIFAPKNVRAVFQEPRLLPWRNVLKNVTFGLEATGGSPEEMMPKATKILKSVGLNDYEKYLPRQLSLGMKQRVNFARALVCEPELLLLDEPFSALDTQTKKMIITEFKKIIQKSRITTVFVTHNIDEAKFLASRIVKIDGKFVASEMEIEDHALDALDGLIEVEL